jgi:hypothetical protein
MHVYIDNRDYVTGFGNGRIFMHIPCCSESDVKILTIAQEARVQIEPVPGAPNRISWEAPAERNGELFNVYVSLENHMIRNSYSVLIHYTRQRWQLYSSVVTWRRFLHECGFPVQTVASIHAIAIALRVGPIYRTRKQCSTPQPPPS